MKVYLSPGRPTFPPCTRIGEEAWETVAVDGTVICPSGKGGWTATLRPSGDGYLLDYNGRSQTPARPYVETDEVKAHCEALKKKVETAEAELHTFLTEMVFAGVQFPADAPAETPPASPDASPSSTPPSPNTGGLLVTFPDQTQLVRVHGCPSCKRWTMVRRPIEPREYPYHKSDCEWRWEPLPERVAHLSPETNADGTNRLLQVLPEGVDPLTWTPPLGALTPHGEDAPVSPLPDPS